MVVGICQAVAARWLSIGDRLSPPVETAMHRMLDELQSRGLLSDCTDLAGLDDGLRRGPLRMYVGFDPTASSLHVGSLMPLFVARLVRAHGHVPVLLVGGATGIIG